MALLAATCSDDGGSEAEAPDEESSAPDIDSGDDTATADDADDAVSPVEPVAADF
ncbi:MAG: ABC transporter substrate-binding protein, partial [Actinobacteria bacterium]|nr:ABC transporter substrate-binding protein [Actinomycetota bacterium]NIV59013.1 ABC transporter substrate-binding protein [Actinomycetota bacterium]NIX53791.1 ABC transporter substrate-binding protein [Actinomycetota bacterium]